MTAATLNHTQTRTASVPPALLATAPYRVVDVINSFTGFPDGSVFVFKVADGLFDHVATVLDMQTYFNTLLAAQGANHAYYRQLSVTKDFSTMEVAQDFGTTLISRMTSLCKEYDITAAAFVGVTGPINIP